MYNYTKRYSYHFATVAVSTLLLNACGSDDDNVTQPPPAPVNYSYEVTVTNLTNAQPLSPLTLVLHRDGNLWMVGESASEALEMMAEGGDNSALLALPMVDAGASGAGILAPGSTESVMVTIEDIDDAKLSLATMLVNTNDGFTGLNAWQLNQLSVGQSWSTPLMAYDAGTEKNTEASGSIPGPADSGVGFDAARDDLDFVADHPGVVTAADNLITSVLDAQHTFDNPVAILTVNRIE
ncbi:spondin domain-containing protein [Aliiglaciecola sp. LCG003]|uniref:spondin domain-containing protein n=1 Tax=Aliiglaciecola sp. LCG003 TaxID=3053655 RepID=UPI0025726023|nr:spondin domain-containing protein [Aliiglaciecola sp. LCG003]WJG09075.1 spondin domain-containing protein [Aliiglaciecola sp. LCG003]